MKTKAAIGSYYHLAFPIQAMLVTCQNQENETNIITLAWHTPISKKPPLYGISIAPSRLSHQLIEKAKEFVINFMPYEFTQDIHYCGTHSGRKFRKIDHTHLHFEASDTIQTLRIKEAYAHLECRLDSQHTIGDHTLFIGEILDLCIEDHAYENSILNNSMMKPSFYLGHNTYATIDEGQQRF